MKDTKRRLYHAARIVVQRDGADRLTLDAVAKEAGVSKGGVLYHFPTKTALLQGLLTEMVLHFNDSIAHHHSDVPGGWMRAYLLASALDDAENAGFGVGLLAAIANDPSLLATVRQQYQQWQHQAETDGGDPVLATIIRLAADGLYLADLFAFSPPTGELRKHVLDRLLVLASESAKSKGGS